MCLEASKLTALLSCAPCRYGEFGIGGGTSQYCDRLAKTPAEVRSRSRLTELVADCHHQFCNDMLA
jgi:hypothetical protein